MYLALRERYWIKFCLKLTTVIFLDNYYSQYHHFTGENFDEINVKLEHSP
jgi:hypothetical protein